MRYKTIRVFGVTFKCLLMMSLGSGVHAESSASASIEGLSITLNDIDPNDGISPQLSFYGYSLSSGWLDPLAGYPYRPSPDPILTYYQPGGAALNEMPASSAAMSAAGMASSSVITANSLNVVVSATQGQAEGQAYSGVLYDPSANLAFSLSPRSTIVISGFASVRARSDGATVGQYYWQNSASTARVSLNIVDAEGLIVPGGFDGLEVHTGYGPAELQSARTVTVMFSNQSDAEVRGAFYFTADAASTAVVPEPSASAMLLLGGVLIANVTRRRQVRAQRAAIVGDLDA